MLNDRLVQLFVIRHSSTSHNGVILHWPRAEFGLQVLMAPQGDAVVPNPECYTLEFTLEQVVLDTSHFSLLSAEREMLCVPAETLTWAYPPKN